MNTPTVSWETDSIMCGIAGYIGTTPPNKGVIQTCHNLMRRRGPDTVGYYHHKNEEQHVVLLHSRLSIIDLDARANQPMQRGAHIIITNGEIYNFVEIRRELAQLGDGFETQSDTEVLLAAINRWGVEEALRKCEGMWALAHYNKDTGFLTLARDRFGEKPLFLLRANNGIFFGSEVKFLIALAESNLTPNRTQLRRLIIYGYRALYKQNETFFEDIYELSAGCTLRLGNSTNNVPTRYWEPKIKRDETLTFDNAVERSRDAVIEAVRLRLRADVPLAFCMSGGIDSNTLISIATQIFNYDVHGFTVVNEDSRYTEQDMVNVAVETQGLKHTEIPISTDNFLSCLRTLIRQHDAPIFTISAYCHWLLMGAIHEAGYRIAISGTGADELFSGYYDHHLAYLADMYGSPEYPSALKKWETYVRPHVLNPLLRNPNMFIDNPKEQRHLYMNAQTYGKHLTTPWNETHTDDYWERDILRNRMLNELFIETIPPPLHEEDLNAMYFSVENRSPFLDTGLFEASYTIPTQHLVQNGMAKAVLREAMRGIVPDAILDNRRKVGFNAPLFKFLDRTDPQVRSQVLDDGEIYDIVRRDTVETLMNCPDLENHEGLFLFAVINARIFLEEFPKLEPKSSYSTTIQ